MSSRKSMAMRGPLALITLVALAAVAAASAVDTTDGMAAGGRDLLQTAADCARSVPYCNTCESFMAQGAGIYMPAAAAMGACLQRLWVIQPGRVNHPVEGVPPLLPWLTILAAPLPPGRYQFYRGTVTKAICTSCQIGYAVKSSGRACCE